MGYEHEGEPHVTHMIPEHQHLEERLFRLTPKRALIYDIMVFLIDNAQQHCTEFAKLIVRSLVVPDLESEVVMARFFLLSDVLFNARSGSKGAVRYRSCFEELLPDVCETLGRQWLRRIARSSLERSRAATSVTRILGAWRTWDVFPTVFIGGLEALLLGPDADFSNPDAASDVVLRQKLERWFSDVNGPELSIAARRRGLAGPQLSLQACRQRLGDYERYWHSSAGGDTGRGEQYGVPVVDVVDTKDAQVDPGIFGSNDGDALSDSDSVAMRDLEDATIEAPMQHQRLFIPLLTADDLQDLVRNKEH